MNIKTGDTVEVVTGDDRGKRGRVLSVNRSKGKVTVEGIGLVYKHVRRGHPRSPQGGRLHIEMPIDVSNVMLICPETGKPTRVGVRVLEDGSKERFAKKSNAGLGQVSPPKASRATT